MSILNKLNNLTKASSENRKVPMTEAQVLKLKTKLMDENRVNVYANKFDIKKPYRVQIRKGKQYFNHGIFSDLDAATAVGTIVSAAAFGDRALGGNYDQDKAEASSEFQAWLQDERNQEVIAIVAAA